MKDKNILYYFNQNYTVFFILIFFCIFFSTANTQISNNIDEALFVSGTILIPDENSPQLEFFKDSLSLVIYIQAALIKIGLTNYTISNLSLFISTVFFSIGIYLVCKNLLNIILKKNSNLISLIFTSLLLLSDTHMPHTDYPNAYFGAFTAGIYSIALTTLIFGLLIENKTKLVIFFAILLFLYHPVQGLWVGGVLFLLYIIDSIFIDKTFKLQNLKYIILGISVSVITAIYFLFIYSEINSAEIDAELFSLWMNKWESHRNNLGFNYNYLKITLILFIFSSLLFYIFLKKKDKKIYKFFLFTSLTTLLSTIVYIVYKLTFEYLPLFIIIPMPTRFINSHAMVGYPIILISCLIFVSLISDYFKINKSYSILSIFIVLFSGYIFNHQHDSLSKRFKSIYKNRFEKIYYQFKTNINYKGKKYYDKEFWNRVKDLDKKSYTIITFSTENLTLRHGYMPYLIKITSFDYVPYRPKTITQTVNILTKVYGVNFKKGKKNFDENFIKKIFESRSNDNWKDLKKIFNAKYVLVPINWNINLNLILQNDEFGVYEIQ